VNGMITAWPARIERLRARSVAAGRAVLSAVRLPSRNWRALHPHLCVLSYDEILSTVEIRIPIQRGVVGCRLNASKPNHDGGPEDGQGRVRSGRRHPLRPDAAPERSFFNAGRAAGVEVTAAKDSGWSVYNAAGRTIPNPAAPVLQPEAAERSVRRGLFQSLNASLRSLTQRRGSTAQAPRRTPPRPSWRSCTTICWLRRSPRPGRRVHRTNPTAAGFDPLLETHALRSLAGAVFHDMGCAKRRIRRRRFGPDHRDGRPLRRGQNHDGGQTGGDSAVRAGRKCGSVDGG